MARNAHKLSPNARAILEGIAEGRSYDQILSRFPDLTYLDIFSAAHEALSLSEADREDYAARMDRIKSSHPRAYERWTDEEDAMLRAAVQRGTSARKIALELHRQTSAIRSRIAKLEFDREGRENGN